MVIVQKKVNNLDLDHTLSFTQVLKYYKVHNHHKKN